MAFDMESEENYQVFLNALLQDTVMINRYRSDILPINLDPLFTLADIDDYPDFPEEYNKNVGDIVTCSFPMTSEEIDSFQSETIECAICLDPTSKWDSIKLQCRHQFCTPCVSMHLASFHGKKNMPSCALCRAAYSFLDIPNPDNAAELEKVLRR